MALNQVFWTNQTNEWRNMTLSYQMDWEGGGDESSVDLDMVSQLLLKSYASDGHNLLINSF